MQEPIQAALAAFVANCDYSRIPEHFKADARLRVLDWIGCAAAGAHYPQMQIASKYLYAVGDAGGCTIVRNGAGHSTRNAVYLNGIAGHVCELDDGHRTAIGHPGCVTIPVALAVAEKANATGADFLKAVILGYDMFARVGRTVNPSHYRTWHTTGTAGTFAAAAAAASLLKLSPEQTNNALGLAATSAGGLVESFGTHAKATNIALACQNGLDAAELAGLGFTGAHSALLGKKGFVAATCTDPHIENLENPSEETLVSDTAFFKVYSSCGHTNSPLDVTFAMKKKYGLKAEDIKHVTVKTYKVSFDLTHELKTATEDEAKFSLPYCIAIALLYGSVSLNYFAESYRTNSTVLDLARRIEVLEDPEATARFPHRQAKVTVTLKNGTVLEDITLDSCDKADAEQIEAKFAAAVPFYSSEKQAKIIELVKTIDQQPDIRALAALLAEE